MVGAAARGRVDGGGPFVQWGVLSFVGNVTVVVLLRQVLSARFQSEGRLGQAVGGWTLPRGAWAGPLRSLEEGGGRGHGSQARAARRTRLPWALGVPAKLEPHGHLLRVSMRGPGTRGGRLRRAARRCGRAVPSGRAAGGPRGRGRTYHGLGLQRGLRNVEHLGGDVRWHYPRHSKWIWSGCCSNTETKEQNHGEQRTPRQTPRRQPGSRLS